MVRVVRVVLVVLVVLLVLMVLIIPLVLAVLGVLGVLAILVILHNEHNLLFLFPSVGVQYIERTHPSGSTLIHLQAFTIAFEICLPSELVSQIEHSPSRNLKVKRCQSR